jgi:hypothetical protein
LHRKDLGIDHKRTLEEMQSDCVKEARMHFQTSIAVQVQAYAVASINRDARPVVDDAAISIYIQACGFNPLVIAAEVMQDVMPGYSDESVIPYLVQNSHAPLMHLIAQLRVEITKKKDKYREDVPFKKMQLKEVCAARQDILFYNM